MLTLEQRTQIISIFAVRLLPLQSKTVARLINADPDQVQDFIINLRDKKLLRESPEGFTMNSCPQYTEDEIWVDKIFKDEQGNDYHYFASVDGIAEIWPDQFEGQDTFFVVVNTLEIGDKPTLVEARQLVQSTIYNIGFLWS